MTDSKNDDENRKARRAREAAERAEQDRVRAEEETSGSQANAEMDPIPQGRALEESIARSHADPVNPIPPSTAANIAAQQDQNTVIQEHAGAFVQAGRGAMEPKETHEQKAQHERANQLQGRVGDMVWLYPVADTADETQRRASLDAFGVSRPGFALQSHSEAERANANFGWIAGVNPDGTVNLFVVDSTGSPHSFSNVPLVEGDKDVPEQGPFARVDRPKALEQVARHPHRTTVRLAGPAPKVNPLEPKIPPQVSAAAEGVELPPDLRHQSEAV